MSNRASAELIRFFGAELQTQLFQGKLANRFRSRRGGETTVPAGVTRTTQANLQPAYVNQREYEVALSLLSKTGAAPNTREAMAMALVDVAKRMNLSVTEVMAASDTGKLELLELRGIQFLNQLRDPTSRLGRALPVDNVSSLIGHELAPVISDAPFGQGQVFDWNGSCFNPVASPPTVFDTPGFPTRRVAFSPDGKWFATRSLIAGPPVALYDVETWQQSFALGNDITSPIITALSFHPEDPLLVVGGYSSSITGGLRVYNTRTLNPVPNSPSYSFVNWAEWSPSGEYLAVIWAPVTPTNDASLTTLTILRRSDWSEVFSTVNNLPIRPISGAWSPDGEHLAIYGNAGSLSRIAVLETENWTTVRNSDLAGGNVAYGSQGPTIAFMPDNRTIVVPPNSEFRPNDVYRYDYINNSRFFVPVSLGLTYSATVTPDGRYVIVTGSGGLPGNPDATLSVIDATTWEEIAVQSFPDVTLLIDSAFSPDSEFLALANSTPLPEPTLRPLIYRPIGCPEIL